MLMVMTVYLSRTKLMFYMVRGGPNNTRIVKLMSGKEPGIPGPNNRIRLFL